MKKLLFATVLTLSFCLKGFSQTADEKAATKAEKITQELGLSADQTEKIKKIYLDENQKNAALKA